MILVTVGTPYQGFDRLVRAADELAELGEEEVIIQRGNSSYIPKKARHFQWATSQKMEQLTKEARVVISQASAGAIILALHYSKPLVVIPRLRKFGEHFDDHQEDLAVALSEQGVVNYIKEISGYALLTAIQQTKHVKKARKGSVQLIRELKIQLETWAG